MEKKKKKKKKKKKRRSSAQRVPHDLTVELLLRLPAKSLWRFRCVCKSWYALFSDPIFGKRHRARSLPNPALITSGSSVDKGNNITFHVSSFDSEGTLVRHFAKRCRCRCLFVLSICRDLLLTNSFVFNIATQEVVIRLPPSYMALALGQVPSTHEYKVFAVEIHLGQRYKILTLGTDQWRDMDASPSSAHLRGAFANGALHVTRGNDYIESFNLEQEEWGLLAPPPLTRPNYDLTELSGYLCLLDRDDANNHVDIWLLKDYDKGLWVKEYTICLSTLKAWHFWVVVNPLLIEDDGRLVVQVGGYSLQLYDPKTKCSREIQHFEEIEHASSFHVKCFASLGHRVRSRNQHRG